MLMFLLQKVTRGVTSPGDSLVCGGFCLLNCKKQITAGVGVALPKDFTTMPSTRPVVRKELCGRQPCVPVTTLALPPPTPEEV